MFITMNIGGMPFDGSTIPSGQSLGGSESAGYYLAKALVKRGHDVSVFTTKPGTNMISDGVKYHYSGEISERYPLGHIWHNVIQAPCDAIICQRHPFAFTHQNNGTVNLWWLHDLALRRLANGITSSLVNTDSIIAVSPFHKKQIHEIYGIENENIHIAPNIIDYDEFTDINVIRQPNSFLFAARPERGLDHYLKIAAMMPDKTFYFCGYENTTTQMEAFYAHLWKWADTLPNVTNLGPLSKKELYKHLSSVQALLMPTTFEETFCTLAVEAQAAGTPVIASDVGAVGSTIAGGGVHLIPLKNGSVDIDGFVEAIQEDGWKSLKDQCKNIRYNAETISELWENIILQSIVKKKDIDYKMLAQHLEQMSDIVALNDLFGYDEDMIEEAIQGYKKNYAFFINNDYQNHYDRYYEYEKSRGVIYGPEDLSGNKRFETIHGLIKDKGFKTILDYGCAHGHYVMNLAKRMPDVKFTGFDINQQNINIARSWACDEKTNASFICGTHQDLYGSYDLIIAAEVLEHVPNPVEVVHRLKQHLNPGGTMLISTPYGPWEALGYNQHPGWRAHIHHFERQDLKDIFGDQDGYRLFAVPHQGAYGHFICTFQKSDASLKAIDYGRKLGMQNVRQTVSLCMIAKDERHNIGKVIEAMYPHVDEIVVGVDKSTTDNTMDILKSIPGVKAFHIESPLKTGFAEARNQTVIAANSDWIFWMDCDETVDGPEFIKKYCRQNPYNGYGIAQHHISAKPTGILKTDYPVRLFRNFKGIKFAGLIHEHPEREINEGVGKVCQLSEVAIMHNGYRNEIIRRDRFLRNYPLMIREMIEGNGRTLSKFLFARDISLMNQYEFEHVGMITDDMVVRSEQVIEIWRELVQENLRMAIDCLEYYTSSTRILKGEYGLDFTFMHGLKSRNGIEPAKMDDNPITGCFMSEEDINLLTGAIVHEKAGVYGEYY